MLRALHEAENQVNADSAERQHERLLMAINPEIWKALYEENVGMAHTTSADGSVILEPATDEEFEQMLRMFEEQGWEPDQ